KAGVQLDGPKSPVMPYGRNIKSCTLNKRAGSCSFSFTGLIAGSYSYIGFAYDNAGKYAQSAPRSFTISSATPIYPTISVSHSPANPVAKTNTTITATAADDVKVTRVTIYLDDKPIKVCTPDTATATCSVTFSYPAAGTHTYYATATDSTGLNVSSSATLPSVQVMDVSTLNTAFSGYTGTIFEGKYVYFVPYSPGGQTNVLRYDTTGNFTHNRTTTATTHSSWQVFDLKKLQSNFYTSYSTGISSNVSAIYIGSSMSGWQAAGYLTFGNFTHNQYSWYIANMPQMVYNTHVIYHGASYDNSKYAYYISQPGSPMIYRYDTTVAVGGNSARDPTTGTKSFTVS
ncbi:TPA: hypothetical protein H1009_00385, partial [archaeon]|nr:hypothetical protein [Candidatus Naiadarchaeales archaeon SRR2090153.bin461]